MIGKRLNFPTAMFIDKVKDTILKYNLLEKYDKVLVALSGGPDSVALLFSLKALKKEFMLDLYAAHLDHKFRGEESREDMRFCKRLAEKLGVPIACGEKDVPALANEKGISSEEAARQERYDFLMQTAADMGIKKIAVGHNSDDQAETVLMRTLRGAGTAGLGGMSFSKKIGGYAVIRPLMELSRKEIERFISENDISVRKDSSNDETVFTRNKIRHEVLPFLEKEFNPNLKDVLCNMAENLREENDFINKYSKRKFRGMSRRNGKKEILLDIRKLKKQEPAVMKRIVRAALEESKGNLRRFTYRHWKEIEDLIYNRPVRSVVDLPGGIDIEKKRSALSVINKT